MLLRGCSSSASSVELKGRGTWYRLALDHVPGLLETDRPVIVAIDGPCGSGKSTLTALPASVFSCNVFHIDDFYLPPVQRTNSWREGIGSSMNFRRIREELLEPAGGALLLRLLCGNRSQVARTDEILGKAAAGLSSGVKEALLIGVLVRRGGAETSGAYTLSKFKAHFSVLCSIQGERQSYLIAAPLLLYNLEISELVPTSDLNESLIRLSFVG